MEQLKLVFVDVLCINGCQMLLTSDRFLTVVLPQTQDLCLGKQLMMGDFKFKDEEIT